MSGDRSALRAVRLQIVPASPSVHRAGIQRSKADTEHGFDSGCFDVKTVPGVRRHRIRHHALKYPLIAIPLHAQDETLSLAVQRSGIQ